MTADAVGVDGNEAPASAPIPTSPEALFHRLDELGIAHETHRHPPLHTVEDSKALRGDLPGGHVKNLFLKARKGSLWLVTALEDTPIDLKRLARFLGIGGVSFANADRLFTVLGVYPGAVTPFALINDTTHAVSFVLDQALLQRDPVNVHPLVNDATTTIATADLLRFVEATGHAPRTLDLARIAAAD